MLNIKVIIPQFYYMSKNQTLRKAFSKLILLFRFDSLKILIFMEKINNTIIRNNLFLLSYFPIS